MRDGNSKKRYAKPAVVTAKVFEQAALSCVVRNLGVANVNTLKIGTIEGGCGFTSS